HAGLRENLLRVSRADAVDVREGVQNFLVAWQVHARYACHGVLSLPLLVLGTALADDADDTPPLDHLTMLADRFDAGPNLQTARRLGARRARPSRPAASASDPWASPLPVTTGMAASATAMRHPLIGSPSSAGTPHAGRRPA